MAPPPSVAVLIHGLNGQPGDFDQLAATLRSTVPSCVVLQSKATTERTHDGVRLGGERVAEELWHFVEEGRKSGLLDNGRPAPLVVVGHSLGGVVARSMVGVMEEQWDERGWGQRVVPASFVTVATPHLGAVRASVPTVSTWFQRYLYEPLTRFMLRSRLGQTGLDLGLADDAEAPLLLRMTEPSSPCMEGLKRFGSAVTTCGMAHHDLSVPYATSLMTRRRPTVSADLQELRDHLDDPTAVQLVVAELGGFGDATELVRETVAEMSSVCVLPGATDAEFDGGSGDGQEEALASAVDAADGIDSLFQACDQGLIRVHDTMHRQLTLSGGVRWRRVSTVVPNVRPLHRWGLHVAAVGRQSRFGDMIPPNVREAAASLLSQLVRLDLEAMSE